MSVIYHYSRQYTLYEETVESLPLALRRAGNDIEENTAYPMMIICPDSTVLDHEEILVKRELIDLLVNGLLIDGGWHKQWYLWQIVEALGLDLSVEWDEEYPEPDKGIAP